MALQVAEQYFVNGEIKQKSGDLKGALIDFTQALNADPGNAKYFKARGQVKFELGDIQGSLDDFNKSKDLEQSSPKQGNIRQPPPRKKNQHEYVFNPKVGRAPREDKRAAALIQQGLTCHLDQRFKDAAFHFVEAIKLDPGNGAAFKYLGNVLGRIHLVHDSRIALLQSIALTPEDPEAWGSLAELRILQGDLKRGIALLERASQLEPSEPMYILSRVLSRMRMGEWKAATSELESMLQNAPELRAQRIAPDFPTMAEILKFAKAKKNLPQLPSAQFDKQGFRKNIEWWTTQMKSHAALTSRDANAFAGVLPGLTVDIVGGIGFAYSKVIQALEAMASRYKEFEQPLSTQLDRWEQLAIGFKKLSRNPSDPALVRLAQGAPNKSPSFFSGAEFGFQDAVDRAAWILNGTTRAFSQMEIIAAHFMAKHEMRDIPLDWVDHVNVPSL